MKVTVIGYWGGFPGQNEATSGYLFQHEGFNMLVDCGSGVVSQLQNYLTIEDIDAVVLSHYHHDHVADIGPLQYGRLIHSFLGKRIDELPIYGHSFEHQEFSRLTYKSITKGITYNPEEELIVGPFRVSFLKTKHPVVCYAMRITAGNHTVVYTADTCYIKEFETFSKNADLLICECNLYANQDGSSVGHMTSIEAGKIAKNANVGELLLTHLPHFGDHQDLVNEAKSIYQRNVQLAKSGLVWLGSFAH